MSEKVFRYGFSVHGGISISAKNKKDADVIAREALSQIIFVSGQIDNIKAFFVEGAGLTQASSSTTDHLVKQESDSEG